MRTYTTFTLTSFAGILFCIVAQQALATSEGQKMRAAIAKDMELAPSLLQPLIEDAKAKKLKMTELYLQAQYRMIENESRTSFLSDHPSAKARLELMKPMVPALLEQHACALITDIKYPDFSTARVLGALTTNAGYPIPPTHLPRLWRLYTKSWNTGKCHYKVSVKEKKPPVLLSLGQQKIKEPLSSPVVDYAKKREYDEAHARYASARGIAEQRARDEADAAAVRAAAAGLMAETSKNLDAAKTRAQHSKVEIGDDTITITRLKENYQGRSSDESERMYREAAERAANIDTSVPITEADRAILKQGEAYYTKLYTEETKYTYKLDYEATVTIERAGNGVKKVKKVVPFKSAKVQTSLTPADAGRQRVWLYALLEEEIAAMPELLALVKEDIVKRLETTRAKAESLAKAGKPEAARDVALTSLLYGVEPYAEFGELVAFKELGEMRKWEERPGKYMTPFFYSFPEY